MNRRDVEVEIGDIDSLDIEKRSPIDKIESDQFSEDKLNKNLYSPPDSDVEIVNPKFTALGIDKIKAKKIYHAWNNVIMLAVVAVLVLTATGVYFFFTHPGRNYFVIHTPLDVPAYIIMFVVPLLVIGTLRKATWGRYLGIFFSFILLFLFPIGTIFGAFGLVGYFQTKPLWGSNQVTRAELKEYFNS